MSLRKFSAIVPDVMAEITRLIDSKHDEKREREKEGVRESVQAGKAHDLLVENRPIDPRKRVGRAGRVRGGRQLELELQQTIRRN
tara:strand:+ start:783 stop:1037 length:255 start_codon:yes stop_codon:yes gene_type:complete